MSFGHTPHGKFSGKALRELEAVGLTAEDVDWFSRTFVGHGYDYIERGLAAGAEWELRKFPLSGRRIADHLLGLSLVGTGARLDPGRGGLAWTQWVLVDLDHRPGNPPLRERYAKVVQALGEPSFVMRSSKSGGWHVYYLLSAPTELYPLRNLRGSRGVVLDLLAAAGAPEAKGLVEVYPRGQVGKEQHQNRIRLPFGFGSALLDPSTRLLHQHSAGGDADLAARLADFRWLRSRDETGELRRVDVAEWYAAAPPVPMAHRAPTATTEPRSTSKDRKGQRRVHGSPPAPRSGGSPPTAQERREERARAARWWTHGLEGPGERNAAFMALALDLRNRWRPEQSREVAEAAAEERIWTWLCEKHNGHSQEFPAHADRVREELRRVVRWRFNLGRPRPLAQDMVPLTAAEALAVLDLLDQFGDGPTLRTGDRRYPTVPRLTLARYLFLRAMLAKAWVYDTADALWAEVLGTCGPVQSLESVADEFTRRAAEWWPDPAKRAFIVDQPWRKLRNLKSPPADMEPREPHPLLQGITEERMARLFKPLAEECGAFVRVRKRDTMTHRAEGFHTNLLSFGSLDAPHDRRLFTCPEHAIAALVPPAHIPGKYSTRGAQRVRVLGESLARGEEQSQDGAAPPSAASVPDSPAVAHMVARWTTTPAAKADDLQAAA